MIRTMAIRIVNFMAKISNNNCSSTIVVMVIVVIISVIRNHNSSTDSRNILATIIVIGINNKNIIIITTRTVVIIGSMVQKVRSPDPSADVRPQGSTSKVLVQGLGLQKPSSAMIWGCFPKIAGRLWGLPKQRAMEFWGRCFGPLFLGTITSPEPKP